jgi:hypothetical protein
MSGDNPVERAARAAARQLAGELGPRTEAQVEMALLARSSDREVTQYDPVAIAALIVAIAQLAWDVFDRLRVKEPTTSREVAERVIRTEIRREFEITTDSTKIIDVVVREIIGGEPRSLP